MLPFHVPQHVFFAATFHGGFHYAVIFQLEVHALDEAGTAAVVDGFADRGQVGCDFNDGDFLHGMVMVVVVVDGRRKGKEKARIKNVFARNLRKCFSFRGTKKSVRAMETTIEEMINQLNRRVNAEHTTVDNRLVAMRRDFETEATKMKQKLVNLGEAVAILASEASRTSANSALNPEVHKRIINLLNA